MKILIQCLREAELFGSDGYISKIVCVWCEKECLCIV